MEVGGSSSLLGLKRSKREAEKGIGAILGKAMFWPWGNDAEKASSEILANHDR